MAEKVNFKMWTILIHGLFWLMLTSVMLLVFNGLLGSIEMAFLAVIINLAGFLILVYGHLKVLLPLFFDRKKYVQYGLGLLVLLIATSLFRFFVGWSMVNTTAIGLGEQFKPSFFGSMMVSGGFIIMMSIPLQLIDNWFKKQALEKELKTHQLEAELRFLKAQVNPHFLFNALNNIYSLSFTESKKTPEMILKLSDMMSYMLYDCKSEQVLLSAEISYLKNYIALQQLKKDGEYNIEFDVKGDHTSVMITPMLFIPFFENAFKHGNLDDIEHGWLKSELVLEREHLIFNISNTVRKERQRSEKGGVGLENIRERLRLLFPARHVLNIENIQGIYSVHLQINLSNPNES